MTRGQNKDEAQPQAQTLGGYVRQKREAAGFTVRALAAKVGLYPSYVTRLEQDLMRQPSPEKLQRIAEVLSVGHEDLYALAGYQALKRLPAVMPYLRAKYRMTEETAEELATYFARLKRERRIVERTAPMTRKADDLGFGSPESVKWENL